MAKAPYKYNSKIPQKIREYVDSCGIQQMEIPTIEGLALKLDVNDDTIVEWVKKYPAVKREYNRLKMAQKNSLIQGGAFGGKEVNVSMFIFLLKVNHNMIETKRLVGDPDKPLGVVVLPELNEEER